MKKQRIIAGVLIACLLWLSAGFAADGHADEPVPADGPYRRVISLYGAHTENLMLWVRPTGLSVSTARRPTCPGSQEKRSSLTTTTRSGFWLPIRISC